MSLFVIADLHLPFGVNKSMNIFDGWDNYVERLEYNWQSKVRPADTVVLPGDLCWALKLEESLPDFKFLENLNGTKIISKGNHDLWWSTVSKIERFFENNGISSVKLLHNNYYSYGRYGICGTRGWISENGEPADQKVLAREAGRLETSIKAAEDAGLEPIVFLHYPPIYLTGVNEPIMDVLRSHHIKQCFYGHIHGKKGHSCAFKGVKDDIEYHLVSSDYLQFVPLDITCFVQSDE
ncbi:MAG: metallophosphoesterase [Ruminococcus sp.]|nr:metallophosphoesterase [Ruminococcus sp.]